MIDTQHFRPVSYSRTTLTELMIPSYANFGGKIHGGILLSLMDKAAYACASKHAGNYCVTVTVEGVHFLQPVEVGELVSLKASVNYVGNTSLMVGIRVIAENVKTRMIKHTNTSYFTMVAKGDDDRPTPVPGLILEKREDARRFLEAIKRRELSKRYQTELSNSKTILQVEDELHLLQQERCKVAF
ncbi:hotdog domain-containing protein [Pontibacter flavimaris]|uniref:Acyl-CoA thioesterase n=1 Tax=Pontibacter flavimaris TaxID=1797110 RepID=A0A1Q5PF72_9BACT|nr:hotdog domain-containing protein [Pontibacter flavimaris]OKL40792.1 acyl-CoA thioesterase [Pontibacter flavimaris]